MKKTFAIALLAFTTFAQAGDGWTEVAVSFDHSRVYSIKDKSVMIDKNDRGTIVVVGTGRITSPQTKSSEVNKWYVSLSDCDNEMGMLTKLEVDGHFINDTPFVFGQGSIGATIAEVMCKVYKHLAKENTPTNGKSSV